MRQTQLAALLGLFLAASPWALAEEDPAPYLPQPNPTDDYLDAIDRIESDYGPYSSELSDLYLGLGQTLLDKGEYEQAKDAFNRGVMVVRVNAGPNSPEQTNHLYLIASVETALGNGMAADDVMHNIYFINAEYYGEKSAEMLPVLERMYQWYGVVRPANSDDNDYADYERNIGMAEQMVRISESAYGMDSPAALEAYRRLGEAQFQAVRYLIRQGMALTMDAYVAVTSRTLDSAGMVKISISKHYDAGRRVFKEYLAAVEADTTRTPMDIAQAYADVGDWYLAVGKSRTAREHYRQAWQVLSDSDGYAELAENYMADPKPVYFFHPPPDFLEDREAPLPGMDLDISMTVTNYGDVRSAEVVNAPADVPEDVLGDVLRLVRETPFRPAVKAGETVTTREFIWRFSILPPENAS